MKRAYNALVCALGATLFFWSAGLHMHKASIWESGVAIVRVIFGLFFLAGLIGTLLFGPLGTSQRKMH